MRLIGSFQTMTTHGRSSCLCSSIDGCSSSTSAGAVSVLMPGLWRRSRGGGLRSCGLVERELAVGNVDANHVALSEVALEEPQRERVFHEPLDRALEGARAVGRVPAGVGEMLLRGVGQLEGQAPLCQPLAEPRQLEVDDLADLLPGERPELDDLVDPVQELRPEDV